MEHQHYWLVGDHDARCMDCAIGMESEQCNQWLNAHDRLVAALEKIAADEWHSCRLEKACRLTSEHDPDCAIGIARSALALARGEVEA